MQDASILSEDENFELIEGDGHMVLMTSADRSAKFIARIARRVAERAKLAPVA